MKSSVYLRNYKEYSKWTFSKLKNKYENLSGRENSTKYVAEAISNIDTTYQYHRERKHIQIGIGTGKITWHSETTHG